MTQSILLTKEVRIYLVLTSLVICGLAASLITGAKVTCFGVNFPFSNIIFSIFTYPIVDCICELWGKKAARQTMYLALVSQLFIAALIHLSILSPPAAVWHLQTEYQMILAASGKVILASLLAFGISQIVDIAIYQRIKELTRGRWLWLRSNLSTYVGQVIDSIIFVMIVFASTDAKWSILFGSILVKLTLSLLATPMVYAIVIICNQYVRSELLLCRLDVDQAVAVNGKND